MNILEQLSFFSPKILIASSYFLIFWIISIFISSWVLKLTENSIHNREVREISAKTSKVGIVICGLALSLNELGVNVGVIFATLGLVSFAVGFSLRDTLSNFFDGVCLTQYKPFQVGDSIKVGEFSGEVIAMDLRFTSLIGKEKLILIPNSYLLTNPIVIKVNSKK